MSERRHDSITQIRDPSRRLAAERAARLRVLHWLTQRYAPRTVLDVGCGIGTWAAAFLESGCDVLAIDGERPTDAPLQVPPDRFRVVDLEQSPDVPGHFDMALCLEVAEHLTEPAALRLVESMCDIADVIVFSAAIPGQGGLHHLTERWPSYWQHIFEAYGFACDDEIRWAFWDDTAVEWWYRQNLFVARPGAPSAPLRSVVHPALLEAIAEDFQSGRVGLRAASTTFARALTAAVRTRLS